MTTGESAVEKPCDTTVLRFRLDALHHKVDQIRLKASEVSEAAMRAVREAMKAVGMRGPDPDYSEDEDEKRLLIRIIREQQRNSGGHGSVNGGRQSWLRDAAIVVTLGISAWTLKTVIDQGKDITRMQCQLSPATCQQVVVPRGQ